MLADGVLQPDQSKGKRGFVLTCRTLLSFGGRH